MITPKILSLHFKVALHWCLWYRYILFSVDGCSHTSRRCRETEFQQEFAESVYCRHAPCVSLWCVSAHTRTHTHTYFLRLAYQITCYSQSIFHSQVVRRYSVPCEEGQASLLRSADRNHKALQRGSDAIRTAAFSCTVNCFCTLYTNKWGLAACSNLYIFCIYLMFFRITWLIDRQKINWQLLFLSILSLK